MAEQSSSINYDGYNKHSKCLSTITHPNGVKILQSSYCIKFQFGSHLKVLAEIVKHFSVLVYNNDIPRVVSIHSDLI
jgi:hypothetical protein